ncbi:MAG: AAA family ATPase [Succinivibrionaceae bacterium]|nr:AAA family ATPase [Succinivibrionaceae bacterium]
MKDIAQTQCFKDFNRYNYVYIDKTEQIAALLKNRRVFISRPRRFGKSLMLDTIATLFEEGVEPCFKNTWIYDQWKDTRYPVLKLNFLKYTNEYDTFCQLFSQTIAVFGASLHLDVCREKQTPSVAMFNLLEKLNQASISVVILIDEYDAQLTAHMDDPELYEKFRIELRNMYGILKGDPCIRFLGITGVTRLKDVSIFSVGTDIMDLSYYSPVSDIAGFTRNELRKYYLDHIDLVISLDKGISRELITEEQRDEFLDRLSDEYDGYCFDDRNRKNVYSTWSVNCFFADAVSRQEVLFSNYWYENGGMPSVIVKYLQNHKISLEDYAQDICVDIDDFLNPGSLLSMKQEVLMFQAGYLTLCSTVPDGGSVTLRIPNNEVKNSLTRLVSRKMFEGVRFSRSGAEKIFSQAPAAEIVEKLNALMNTISYENYGSINEKTIQGMLHAFFIGADQPVRTELQSAVGRSDIVLEYEKRRLVLELKYAEGENDCRTQLQDAIVQIQTRRYGSLLPVKEELLQIALVFNGAKGVRQFTHYQTVD